MKLRINLYETSKIKIYKNLTFSFIVIEHLKLTFFFKFLKYIKISKKKKSILFNSNKVNLFTCFLLKFFYTSLFNFYIFTNKFFYKKLLLKGLGFKVVSFIQHKYIELKIGFSHFVKIFLPKKFKLNIHVNKNMIIVEGLYQASVGNFANKLKNFRLPDSYKGKGIWYKNETKIFKEIKKT
jgi:ribosomal protein L6P/L9E